MSNIAENPTAEFEHLADKLDQYAAKFAELIEPAISCWILGEKYLGYPSGADIHRNIFRWARIERRNTQPIRVVWLYQDEHSPAKSLLDCLADLGAVLVSLNDEEKVVVYPGWCLHLLADSDDRIAHVIEALFPEPDLFKPPLPRRLAAEPLESMEVWQVPGQYSEFAMKNLGQAAAHFAKALARRMRTDPQALFPPSEGEFCCSVAREEERLRPKKEQEILPIIQKLKMQWHRTDDPGPSNPQQVIDNLWEDMIPLGWALLPCPKLPDTPALARLTNHPAYKNLWREYQAALSQAEAAARLQVSALPSDASAPISIEEGDSVSELPKKEKHSEPCIEPEEPTPFTGGKMVFFQDRVELCGVAICYGKRSQTKRTILDLLGKKQTNGRFASYSGEKLAQLAGLAGGEDSASGAIRDLRDDVTKLLQEEANIGCGREDVILSGGPGYRFADCITVQDGELPQITGIMDMDETSDVRNVRNKDVPNVRNEDASDDAARKRRAWILQRLDESHELQAPAVAKHFRCSVKTAHRDLQALKDECLIEFVGVPRTGHYRLRNPSEADE